MKILADFLGALEVGKLDSAFCRANLRSSFLELLGCAEFKINENLVPPFNWVFQDVRKMFWEIEDGMKLTALNILRWHVVRSVKVRSAVLTKELQSVDAAEIVEFMNVSCRQAEQIFIGDLDISKWIHNPNLHFDTLRSLDWHRMIGRGEELAEVLRRSVNLRDLTLINFSALDALWFKGISVSSVSKLYYMGSIGRFDLTFLANVCPNVISLTLAGHSDYYEIHASAASVVAFKHLLSLIIESTIAINDGDLIRIADGCPQLRHIDLWNHCALHDHSIVYLCATCSMLESIELRNCKYLTNITIQAIGDNLSATLRVLKLNECDAISSCSALRYCRLLEIFSLHTSMLAYICIAGLCKLFECSPALRIVVIIGREIDDSVLHALAHHCSQIEELTIINCMGYTGAGLIAFAKHVTQLKLFRGCCAMLSTEVESLFRVNGCEVSY